MDTYLLMLYVTLEQEHAIRELFCRQGWQFCKTSPASPCRSSDYDGQLRCFSASGEYSGLGHASLENPIVPSDGECYSQSESLQTIPDDFSEDSLPTDNVQKAYVEDSGGIPCPSPKIMNKGNKSGRKKAKLKSKNLKRYPENIPHFVPNITSSFSQSLRILESQSLAEGSVHAFPCLSCEDCFPTFEELQLHMVKVHESDDHISDSGRIAEETNNNTDCKSSTSCIKSNASIEKTKGEAVAFGTDILKEEEVKSEDIQECGHVYPDVISLEQHNKTHLKKNAFECNDCGKTFSTSSTLKVHRRSHTGTNLSRCSICHKPFTTIQHLIRHERIHSGEKPFMCDECGRAFMDSSELRRHKLKHVGARPHQCSLCARTFVLAAQLKVHIKTHSNARPFVCETCGKTFRASHGLVYHRRSHTGERPCQCPQCGRKFIHSSHLKRHMKTHAEGPS